MGWCPCPCQCPGFVAALQASRQFLQHHGDLVVIYALTFFLVLPVCCRTLRNSVYYHQAHDVLEDKMIEANNERASEAEDYFRDLSSRTSAIVKNRSEPVDIYFTVISASRNKRGETYRPRYLKQTLWKLLSLYEQKRVAGYEGTIGVLVCAVDLAYDRQHEVKEMEDFVDVTYRFENKNQQFNRYVDTKHRQDYVFCLNEALQHNASYHVTMEDDALPHDDMYDVINHVIVTKMEQQKVGDVYIPNPDPPLFVKFYHPDRLISYLDVGRDRIPELIAFGAFFGVFTAAIYINCSRRRQDSLLLISLIFFVYYILLALAIGRTNIISVKRFLSPYLYTYVPAAECCTQALLFSQSGASDMLGYLQSAKFEDRMANDLAIHAVAKSHERSVCMVLPNVFTHIGLYSSLHDNKRLNPYIIWYVIVMFNP